MNEGFCAPRIRGLAVIYDIPVDFAIHVEGSLIREVNSVQIQIVLINSWEKYSQKFCLEVIIRVDGTYM
jgi:hypothetical protein